MRIIFVKVKINNTIVKIMSAFVKFIIRIMKLIIGIVKLDFADRSKNRIRIFEYELYMSENEFFTLEDHFCADEN